MPIYEYVCESCKRKTEAIQRVGEKPLKICPHCGGRLKKMFSAPAIQFKGSGFYITDYARAKKEEKKEAAGGESKESAAGGKAEKKETEKPKKAKTAPND
jgi:putative FmdB family regulatory protein